MSSPSEPPPASEQVKAIERSVPGPVEEDGVEAAGAERPSEDGAAGDEPLQPLTNKVSRSTAGKRRRTSIPCSRR
jgi:hypothetical protein